MESYVDAVASPGAMRLHWGRFKIDDVPCSVIVAVLVWGYSE